MLRSLKERFCERVNWSIINLFYIVQKVNFEHTYSIDQPSGLVLLGKVKKDNFLH